MNTTQEVRFNPAGCASIRGQRLHRAETLDELAKSGQTAIRLPDDAIAVKATWALLAPEKCQEIPVWNFKGDDHDPPSKRFFMSNWPDKVQVCRSVGSPRIPDLPEVSLSRFYSTPLSNVEQNEVVNSDIAILLGFHFTSRELPQWFWATLWWHPWPERWPFGHDRPDRPFADHRWRNYVLDIAVDMNWPEEGDAAPNAVFNPYLELGFKYGNRSNCVSCHARSFWGQGSVNPAKMTCEIGPNEVAHFPVVVTEGVARHGDCKGAKADGMTLPQFDLAKQLRLDFLWSLALQPK